MVFHHIKNYIEHILIHVEVFESVQEILKYFSPFFVSDSDSFLFSMSPLVKGFHGLSEGGTPRD